jgi:tetratricopeptide (TPR) repeat protein
MSEALATLEEAIKMAGRNGDLFWYPRMPNCIGWIHRELQDFEGAFKHDRDGVEIGHQHKVLEAEANSLINVGIDLTHAGRTNETISAFHKVREIFERDAWFRWRYNIRLHAAMAEHALKEGEPAKAREIVDRLRETATENEVHKYIAVSHQLMARILVAEGDLPAAEAEYRVALEVLERNPVPVTKWKVCDELGRLKLMLDDADGARASFTEALKIIDEIAATVKDDRLREIFLTSAAVRDIREQLPR